MHDPVADILRQREALGTGAGAGIAVSVLLHGGITALAIYAALHAPPPAPPQTLSIRFAQPRATPVAPVTQKPKAAPKPVAPRIEEPKPDPPKAAPAKPVEKNTVPLSPFGRSTKKGSENPETKPNTETAPPGPVTSTAPALPAGSSGITGLEGGDFNCPVCAQYLDAMTRRIGSSWIPGRAKVVVRFRILRDGTITDLAVETSGGTSLIDRQARGAVLAASPLNPLPPAYGGQFLGVRFTFQ